ncbi:hypothetical protein ACWGH7_12315 [Streptomyces cyaneofuscatus]
MSSSSPVVVSSRRTPVVRVSRALTRVSVTGPAGHRPSVNDRGSGHHSISNQSLNDWLTAQVSGFLRLTDLTGDRVSDHRPDTPVTDRILDLRLSRKSTGWSVGAVTGCTALT